MDRRIKAFLGYDAADALAQAEAADTAIAGGADFKPRPLLGVPVAVKDVLCVKGHPCNCGSKILGKFVSPYDATVIERLKAAGAIVFGRLNMDEFAMGSSTENSAFFTTLNPWDTTRIPGGSSGGSAAAVAADEAIATLGSDTGGSIRQPAALCGVVGLKPTYGRVSRYGLVAFASSLDQIGPFTKDVRDAALIMSVISGLDPRDSTSVPEAVPDYAAALGGNIKGLKLGLPKEYMIGGLDPEVKAAVDAAVRQLQKLGAEAREISLPHTDYAAATYYIIAPAEASANLARFDGIRYGLRVDGADPVELYGKTRGAGFGAEVKWLLRRLLPARPESPHADPPGLFKSVRASGRHCHADDPDRRVQGWGKVRRPAANVSFGRLHRRGERRRHLRRQRAVRFHPIAETADWPATAGQTVRRGHYFETRARLRAERRLAPGEAAIALTGLIE